MNALSPSVAYIIGIVVSLVLLLIAAIISNSIEYEMTSNPKDKGKRKMWFWIFAAASIVVTFIVGYFLSTGIRVPSKSAAFLTATGIASGVSFVVYVVLGFIISKMNGHGKLSNWF